MIDEQGRLIIPPEVAARLHLKPGQSVPIAQDGPDLRIASPLDHLSRIYIEPTNNCNFDCSTCMRNAWDEPLGQMSSATFNRIIEGIRVLPALPLVFFGGFGEPLSHPAIIDMIQAVKTLGARAELITNGSLLSDSMIHSLVNASLDRVWVSIDGASSEGYADVRLGDALPQVITSLEALRAARMQACQEGPRLGIAFVAMKRNIHELPDVIRLGRRLGADRFSISHVLAHTPALRNEVLYDRSYYDTDQPVSEWAPLLQFPRIELNDATREPLVSAMQGRANLSIAGQNLHQGSNTCPFLEKRSMSIRWDGEVSPCLALLHPHSSYLGKTERRVKAVTFGNVNDALPGEIWNTQVYRAFRERLAAFDFSPCVFCNSCEMAESNQEDCFGSTNPACGGCLWAQGFIQCP